MRKHDGATKGNKLLRLFHLLMLDGRRHFQQDLQEYLNCSKQTVLRLIDEIEGVIGANLTSGLEKKKRWYQIRSLTSHVTRGACHAPDHESIFSSTDRRAFYLLVGL